MAEREKADLLHHAASLARSDGMMGRNGARSVNLPCVNTLDSRPMAATEAMRPSCAIECSLLNVCEVPALRSEWYVGGAQGHLVGVGDVRRSEIALRSE